MLRDISQQKKKCLMWYLIWESGEESVSPHFYLQHPLRTEHTDYRILLIFCLEASRLNVLILLCQRQQRTHECLNEAM